MPLSPGAGWLWRAAWRMPPASRASSALVVSGIDSAAVRAALASSRIAFTAPPREGLTAFNARGVAKAIAGQTGAGRVETLFELRAWAATVGGFVKPKVVDQPPTAPRTLFLYVPDRFVPGEV